MKNMLRKSLVGLALVALSAAANAIPTYTAIGNYTILGTNYDVSLLSDTTYDAQSFNDLSPSITFTTQADATAAVNVLFAALTASYDWNPTCAACADGFRVVWASDGDTYSYMTGYYGGAPFGPFIRDADEDNNFSIAQFTATAVPEPATLGLLGLGLVGAAMRRRRKDVVKA